MGFNWFVIVCFLFLKLWVVVCVEVEGKVNGFGEEND